MVESLQMFLFLFKSKYRRKYSWFSPFLCSVLIVLLFCQGVFSKCSELNCVNGVCKNETCVCFEGWQGPECQYCGGKVKLTAPTGIITDGPGNYSVSTACSWVIRPARVEAGAAPPIRVRLESFATECGWDHLYIYDGDSVRAQRLLAVFSGVMEKDESRWSGQVIARSGSVLLHFFSDDAYAMEGFNVTYAAYSCPSNEHRTNCSEHGECEDGTCKCNPKWIGIACDRPLCPDDCNSEFGYGQCTPSGCECSASRAGEACERDRARLGWRWAWREEGEEPVSQREFQSEPKEKFRPPAVAGHVLLNYGDDLLRVGGETFSQSEFLYRYKVSTGEWSVFATSEAPAARFAHSAVLYDTHELIVYGGVVVTDDPERGGGLGGVEGRGALVSNEVWRVRLAHADAPAWRNATPHACGPHTHAPFAHCGGLHISGHTAVVVQMGQTRKPVMLVFFGHSPHYGYLHIVQEYHIEEGVWSVAETKGWAARGGFGHSAVWDALSGHVYVHAGLVSESEATQAPSAALYQYDVEKKIWRPLPSAPTPRYLHSAGFVSPGIMLVFGGNAHNDTAAAAVAGPGSDRCYSSGALLYHVRCATWYPLRSVSGAARAAASAAVLPNQNSPSLIIYGGFDGRVRSDALVLEAGAKCSTHLTEEACLTSVPHTARACVWSPHDNLCLPKCSSHLTEEACLTSVPHTARACVWSPHDNLCLPLEENYKDAQQGIVKACLSEPQIDEEVCMSANWCGACTAAGCVWCGQCFATHQYCARTPKMAQSMEECSSDSVESGGEACARLHSCAACIAHTHRRPHGSEELSQRACYWDYDTVRCRPANSTDDIRSVSAASVCSAPCWTHKTCANCTAEECIWCASAATCVDKNAYGASFPLGGCRAWSTAGGTASCGPHTATQAAPGPAATGCSHQMSCASCRAEPACGWCDDGLGGGSGTCVPGGDSSPHHHPHCRDHSRWHFTGCPRCQCNGHSVCDSSDRCMQPCAGRAVGPHCEACAPGHWGSPLNGGHCTPCECNSLAVSCAADTGRCFCSTKGLAGDRCDKCDNTNHYHADAHNKGACYYDLAVDYQFTFNLSKKEDRHLSAINFRNAPVKPDVDADFSITCSAHARMNLTVRTRNDPTERTLFSDVNCTNFRYKFAKSEHAFGVEDNVTLTTFFVYVYDFRPPLWIQISFSQYPKLNLQQFFITFSSCFLLLLLVAAGLWKIKQKYDMYRRRQRLFVEMEQMASRPFSQVCVELEKGGGGTGVPAPVSLEPCAGGRAAVLSLLVRLPTGGTGRAPPLGGLAVASALVTLGHHAAPHRATVTSKRPRHH